MCRAVQYDDPVLGGLLPLPVACCLDPREELTRDHQVQRGGTSLEVGG